MSEFLGNFAGWIWGMPLVVLLTGGGLFLTIRARFLPMHGFFKAWKLILGMYPEEKSAKGQISHLGALCNALSSTIGMGNIAGVAVAIASGGPGAIFWMWVSAGVGMCSKFFECTLAVMYRGEDYCGEVQGGPMYVIENGLGKKWKPLAYLFAIFALVGCLSMYQTNQLAVFLDSQYSADKGIVGIICAILTFIVVIGGVKRIAQVSTKVVPVMVITYVIAGLAIIFMHLDQVPDVFRAIFSAAFTGEAAFGAFSGIAVREIMKTGIKRAAFSNEAGVGSAPLAHGNAKTNDPVKEGVVAMMGPFLDTIVVCTITAFVILLSVDFSQPNDLNGVELTILAFRNNFSDMGVHILGFAIFLFAFSSMVGLANYGIKCWDYIFKGKYFLKEWVYVVFYCFTLYWAAVNPPEDVLNILDIGFGLMAFPAMFSTLMLSGRVMELVKKSEFLNGR